MAAPDQVRFYQTLRSRNSIRLLRRAGNASTVPQFWLEEYDISLCPSFVAISYTWSPPYFQDDNDKSNNATLDFSAQIGIDCEPFCTTQNMLDALNCALEKFESEYFWMDQCCINQASLVEKAQQVGLMHKIYEQAESVIVWLGGHHRFGKNFQWMFGEFASFMRTVLENQGPSMFQTTQPAAVALFADLSVKEYEKRHHEAEMFYKHCRFFERTWVRQEIVLARQIRMFCGDLEIATEGLPVIYNIFTFTSWHKYTKCKRTAQEVRRDSAFGAFGIWISARQAYRDKSSSMIPSTVANPTFPFVVKRSPAVSSLLGLWHIASRLQQSTCSDPRDKIYAALPFAARMFESNSPEMPIQPNYNISPERLYINFCTIMIRETESLTFLAHVDDFSERELTLPSWVKDFSSKSAQKVVDLFSAKAYQNKVLSMGLRKTVIIHNDRLSSFGRRFASISRRSTDPRVDPPDEYVPSLLALIRDAPGHIDHVPRLEALWRTLVCDMYREEGMVPGNDTRFATSPVPEQFAHAFYAFLATQLAANGMSHKRNGESVDSFSAYLASLLLPFKEDLPDWNVFVCLVLLLAHGVFPEHSFEAEKARQEVWKNSAAFEGILADGRTRPVFMTEEGFIGNGPLDLQVGDEVWFVHSCAVPLVFRPRAEAGTYTLIGGCYLHGFMHTTHMFDPGYGFVDGWCKFTLV